MVKCSSCGKVIPSTWTVCPFCKAEVSPYAEGASWKRVSPEQISPEAWKVLREADKGKLVIRKLLDDVRSFIVKRDFESMLRAGMEALVEIGRLFPSEASWAASGASVYNSIAISLLSAHNSEWDYATRFITKAIEAIERVD